MKKITSYRTIGVRFLFVHNLGKVYTYRIAKSAKVTLGQLLISPPNCDGIQGIVCVVAIHATLQDHSAEYKYKFITEKVAKL